MFNKNDTHKDRYGCRSCRYEEQSMIYSKCMHCTRQKSSNWTKKKPKPVHCECCGQVKP